MNPDDPRNNCKMQERCECLARNASPHRSSLRMFCEEWQEPEKQLAALHEQAVRNWKRLPDQVRVPCLDALRRQVPGRLQQEWREQKARGVAIGSNRVRFHFDEGMAVRNILRSIHRDDFLPSGNWDDSYYGAIDELATTQATSVPTVSRIGDTACEFCGVDAGTMHASDCPKLREYPAVFNGLGVRSVVADGRTVPVLPPDDAPRPYHAGRVKLPSKVVAADPPLPDAELKAKEIIKKARCIQYLDVKTRTYLGGAIASALTDRVVIQTGGVDSCHHHRLTRECPICKRLAAAAKVSIPVGVYYNREHDNFYSFEGTGMGDAFYSSWREHKELFPIRPGVPEFKGPWWADH